MAASTKIISIASPNMSFLLRTAKYRNSQRRPVTRLGVTGATGAPATGATCGATASPGSQHGAFRRDEAHAAPCMLMRILGSTIT